jgi:hypothetical protein
LYKKDPQIHITGFHLKINNLVTWQLINSLTIIKNQFVKSLSTSLSHREEFPLFGYLFPAAQAGKRGDLPPRSRFGEGRGEIF